MLYVMQFRTGTRNLEVGGSSPPPATDRKAARENPLRFFDSAIEGMEPVRRQAERQVIAPVGHHDICHAEIDERHT